ncbi:MAG: hypothetical protein JSV68_02200 [Anaerolineaceae bacterium]|nr:MAG: hypothetical protein JSV68_02200 [Anaerolineaceae bacterium]
MKKTVFPDSSVLLHFSPLDEIDLPRLFDCTEVEVLFTREVMKELIRHQGDHPVSELQQRAKETIERVEKWLENQQAISPGVTASFLGRQPDSETMERYGLNWQRQGDMLLGALLEYKQARADKAVILLTGDGDLALRAGSLGIEAARLTGDHTLAEDENVLQADRQKTRQELGGFRFRASSLSLSFAGGKDEVAVSIVPQLDSLTATMQAQLVAVAADMRRETAQHQAEDVVEATLDDLDTLAALVAQALPSGGRSFLGRVAQEKIEQYRREVEAYPEKFERSLRHCLEMINEQRRTIRLDLEMENTGGAPAENVLLVLTVPEQLKWYWRPDDRDMPAPPTPPGPKGQVLERGFYIGEVSSVPSRFLDRDYMSGEEPAGAFPVISEAGNQLQWELGTYRHHQSRLLEPLYVRFSRADDIANFAIACEIRERNSPSLVREWLLVSVDTLASAGEIES